MAPGKKDFHRREKFAGRDLPHFAILLGDPTLFRPELEGEPAISSPNAESAHGHEIFVSYQRGDKDFARRLVDALERATGWRVWWDPELHGGERFGTVIRKAIDDADCVLVLWSRRSVDSEFVCDEADRARKQHKLLPVLIEEDVELPLGFGRRHAVELFDPAPGATGFDKLVADAEGFVRRGKKPKRWSARELAGRLLPPLVPLAVVVAVAVAYLGGLGKQPIVEYWSASGESAPDRRQDSFYVQNISEKSFAGVEINILVTGEIEEADVVIYPPADIGPMAPDHQGGTATYYVDRFDPGEKFLLEVTHRRGSVSGLQRVSSEPPFVLESRSPWTSLIRYRDLGTGVVLAISAFFVVLRLRREAGW